MRKRTVAIFCQISSRWAFAVLSILLSVLLSELATRCARGPYEVHHGRANGPELGSADARHVHESSGASPLRWVVIGGLALTLWVDRQARLVVAVATLVGAAVRAPGGRSVGVWLRAYRVRETICGGITCAELVLRHTALRVVGISALGIDRPRRVPLFVL